MISDSPGSSNAGIVLSDLYKQHVTPPDHPESPARIDAIRDALADAELLDRLARIEPRLATIDELLLCHSREYIETVEDDVRTDAGWLTTGDTPISERSFEIARLAVGGVLNAVDAVVSGSVRRVFCAVRPPGHHATRTRGKGFCIFNNVAIAARYAQHKHQLARVLIADFDVHHGDGTQELFYADPTVFYFSTHQWPWYPGTGLETETGQGAGEGATLNCIFRRDTPGDEIVAAWRDLLVLAAEKFEPELVLISAGFDGREGDSLGQFGLRDEHFAELTDIACRIADRHAAGRLVSTLEGGYNLPGLGSAVAAHVQALLA